MKNDPFRSGIVLLSGIFGIAGAESAARADHFRVGYSSCGGPSAYVSYARPHYTPAPIVRYAAAPTYVYTAPVRYVRPAYRVYRPAVVYHRPAPVARYYRSYPRRHFSVGYSRGYHGHHRYHRGFSVRFGR